MARISSAADGGKLPPWSPQAVAIHLAAHTELKSIGLNWTKAENKVKGMRFWQLSFRTAEALEDFIAEMNGSMIDATKVLVSRFIP